MARPAFHFSVTVALFTANTVTFHAGLRISAQGKGRLEFTPYKFIKDVSRFAGNITGEQVASL